jgi:hypothetical protein
VGDLLVSLRPPFRYCLRFRSGLGLLSWPRLRVAAAVHLSGGLVAVVPGVAGPVGPCLVLRVAGFELLPSGGKFAGECAGAGGLGGVVADLAAGGLLEGVSFGAGGAP